MCTKKGNILCGVLIKRTFEILICCCEMTRCVVICGFEVIQQFYPPAITCCEKHCLYYFCGLIKARLCTTKCQMGVQYYPRCLKVCYDGCSLEM